MVHGVVGYACSPTMQTPSPTQKPLAGMHASAAAAERVFSAQPIVQETESAGGTDEKDEAYGIGFVDPLVRVGVQLIRKSTHPHARQGCNTQQIGSTLRSAAAILLPPRNYCGEAGEAGSAI